MLPNGQICHRHHSLGDGLLLRQLHEHPVEAARFVLAAELTIGERELLEPKGGKIRIQ